MDEIFDLICVGILAIFLLASLVAKLWVWFTKTRNENKCPQCGEDWAAVSQNEALVGIFPKAQLVRTSRHSSDVKMVQYGKYRLHYKCKACDHEWVSYTSRKL